jgi:hypothetical protein
MSADHTHDPPTRSLDDLVPGSAEEVRAAMHWMAEGNRRLRELMRGIRATMLDQEHPATERQIVASDAFAAAGWLARRDYEPAVAPNVAGVVSRYVDMAVRACCVIAAVAMSDSLTEDRWESLGNGLAELNLARLHLGKLQQLLAAVASRRQQAPFAALLPEHLKILEALRDAAPRTVLQCDLEASPELCLSRRTLGPLLKQLRDWELVDRPFGPRKGYAVTPLGTAALA